MNELFQFLENPFYEVRIDLHPPTRCTVNFVSESIINLSTILLNTVLENINSSESLNAFRFNVKHWTLNHQPYPFYPRTRFRVNLPSIVALISRSSLSKQARYPKFMLQQRDSKSLLSFLQILSFFFQSLFFLISFSLLSSKYSVLSLSFL